MMEDLAALTAADPNVRRLGRTCSTEFVLAVDQTPYHVVVASGVVTEVLKGPFRMRGAAFRIGASRAAWDEFKRPIPRPGFHDIFAMHANGHAAIEGDIPTLLTHLGFFKALLACLRKGSQANAG